MGQSSFFHRAPGMRSALAAASLFALQACSNPGGDDSLVVITSGGVMRTAQIDIIGAAHKAAGGGPIIWGESVGGNLVEVYAQDRAKNVRWDVIVANPSAAARACERGVLSEIPLGAMGEGANGEPPEEDFIPAAVDECFVGSIIWSLVIGYDCNRPAPAGAADFFDLEKFPGKRGLQKWPVYSLELALVADGVAPGDVYDVLATQKGIDRAFAKLDTIKDEIVWWESGAQAAQLLADKEVVMGISPSARIVTAALGDDLPLCIQWNNQIVTKDVWVIPRGSRKQDAAMAFLRIATAPEIQARLSERMPYAPARRSALPLVGESPTFGVNMQPYLPTASGNLKDPIYVSDRFWSDREAAVLPQFYSWLER